MPNIALSGPADLLATIPYHLGFYPARSVVVVCFHDNRIGLMARVDAITGWRAAASLDSVLPALRREAPTSVTIAAFESSAGETRELHQALADGVSTEGVEIREQLLVRDGRWYSLDCDRRCCPTEGLPMPHPADVPAVATFVGLGQAVLSDRATMARLVEPLDARDPAHDEVAQAIDHWQQVFSRSLVDHHDERPRREELIDDVRRCWRDLLDGELSNSELRALLPQLVAPLRFTELRDGIIAGLCPGTMSRGSLDAGVLDQLGARLGNELSRALPVAHDTAEVESVFDEWDAAMAPKSMGSRLARLCRATPAQHAVPALSVLALHSWWAGDGALAGMAVDQGLAIEDDHRLCGLIRVGLDHGLRGLGTAA